MPDPRIFTVQSCPSAYGDRGAAGIANASNARREFGNAIGKIGNLEILNGIGGGSVGKGLRTLSSISNTIRGGAGALPTSIGRTLDSGANWVLEQTGIGPGVVDALRQFNPGIVNQGVTQAKQIYEQVRQGGFRTSDVPSVLQDLQNLERLGRNIFTPGRGDAATGTGRAVCAASPYAMDLIARAPKFKFLFIVEFIPNAAYAPLIVGDVSPLELAFTVKTCTRPGIKFETEDVNYFNYRTKVITRTEFEPMQMSFYDDTRNAATMFYEAYLKSIAPIANIDPSGGGAGSSLLELRGAEFTDDQGVSTLDQPFALASEITTNLYAGSSGLLAGDEKTIFARINVYHLHDYGRMMTVYNFTNPRITALSPDGLDMAAGSEGSMLDLTFTYDSVFVDPNVEVASSTKYGNIRDKQVGALYPLQDKYGTTNGNPNQGATAIPDSDVFGVPSGPAFGRDLLNVASNATNAVASVTGAATAAVSDLSSKFSNIRNLF